MGWREWIVSNNVGVLFILVFKCQRGCSEPWQRLDHLSCVIASSLHVKQQVRGFCWVLGVTLNYLTHGSAAIAKMIESARISLSQGGSWSQVAQLPGACLNHETGYCFLLGLPCVSCSSSWKQWAVLFQTKTNHILFRSELVFFCMNSVSAFCSSSCLIIKLYNTTTVRISFWLHYAFK